MAVFILNELITGGITWGLKKCHLNKQNMHTYIREATLIDGSVWRMSFVEIEVQWGLYHLFHKMFMIEKVQKITVKVRNTILNKLN